MKRKFTKVIALVLSVALMLSVTAFAAEDDPVFEKKGGGVDGETISVSFNASFTQLNVEYTGSAIQDGEPYMVWMVTGTTVNGKTYYTPTDGTIQYIGQGTASGNTFAFNGVYPTNMVDAAVMISGNGLKAVDTKDDAADGLYTLGYVKMPYLLGDTDLNGEIQTTDAILALRHSINKIVLEGSSFLAADVNRDGAVQLADAMAILRYSIGKIESFN